jgi:hypothetical protein
VIPHFDPKRALKNEHQAFRQGSISSKLKGKDPIRSAFSLERGSFSFQM